MDAREMPGTKRKESASPCIFPKNTGNVRNVALLPPSLWHYWYHLRAKGSEEQVIVGQHTEWRSERSAVRNHP